MSFFPLYELSHTHITRGSSSAITSFMAHFVPNTQHTPGLPSQMRIARNGDCALGAISFARRAGGAGATTPARLDSGGQSQERGTKLDELDAHQRLRQRIGDHITCRHVFQENVARQHTLTYVMILDGNVFDAMRRDRI